jgi:hypothetical protein
MPINAKNAGQISVGPKPLNERGVFHLGVLRRSCRGGFSDPDPAAIREEMKSGHEHGSRGAGLVCFKAKRRRYPWQRERGHLSVQFNQERGVMILEFPMVDLEGRFHR